MEKELIKEIILKQPDEFLLIINEGTEDEVLITLGQYIRMNDEADRDILEHLLEIGHLAVEEQNKFGADSVKRIN